MTERRFSYEGEEWLVYLSGVDGGGPAVGGPPRISRFGVWFRRPDEPQKEAIPGIVSRRDLDDLLEDELRESLEKSLKESEQDMGG